jgi:hypothetical protein
VAGKEQRCRGQHGDEQDRKDNAPHRTEL